MEINLVVSMKMSWRCSQCGKFLSVLLIDLFLKKEYKTVLPDSSHPAQSHSIIANY